MNVCKVPDMYKDMEYKYITEDSKTRVYLSVVREFNEAEYEKYYIRKKKEKVRKRILFIARALKYALPVHGKHDSLQYAFQISFILKEEAMKLAQK